MELSFEQLKSMVVFAQVVERGSFSAAAKHLGLTRAVVSYHVKKLESQLGMKLLNRSTRTLALTEAGNFYYESCRIIAEQASSAQQKIDNFKNEPEGLLKITCPVNMGLQLIVPVLNEFRRLYPKIDLDVQLSDDIVNIMQEGIDLAIRGAPLSDSGLQAKLLATLPTCICGSADYFRQRGRPTSHVGLEQHDWVVYRSSPVHLELSKGGRTYKVKMRGPVTTNNIAARIAFIEGGNGLARIAWYDAKPRVIAGTLERILEDYEVLPIDVYAVFPPGTASSKKLRLLLDFMQENFRRSSALKLAQP